MPKPSRKRSINGQALSNSETERNRLVDAEVELALNWLKRHSTKVTREGMARYAIPSERAFGVSMSNIQLLAKRLGRSHELAAALWKTGWYEVRMLASYVDEPTRVTSKQMDDWCNDFDSWAICDTVCFALFDRTPHAWSKVEQWSSRGEEFVKRAAFALLWGLSVHDKDTEDSQFAKALLLVERAANDERNFVKKSANMALRSIGKRNLTLNRAAVTVAQQLAASSDTVACWNGRNAFKELTSQTVASRLARSPGPKPDIPQRCDSTCEGNPDYAWQPIVHNPSVSPRDHDVPPLAPARIER